MLTSAKDWQGNIIFLDFFKRHEVLRIFARFQMFAILQSLIKHVGANFTPPLKSKCEGKMPRWKQS